MLELEGEYVGNDGPPPVEVRARAVGRRRYRVYMKMPSEWLGENNQVRFIGPYRQLTAPVVLWGCVGSLACGQEPEFTLAEADIRDGQTRWRLLWVTETKIVYVDAMKARNDWSAYDGDSDEGIIDELVAWARPRDSIVTVSLDSASARHVRDYSKGEKTWHWDAAHRVTFRDGTDIALPLFEQYRSNEHESAIAELVRSLTV